MLIAASRWCYKKKSLEEETRLAISQERAVNWPNSP